LFVVGVVPSYGMGELTQLPYFALSTGFPTGAGFYSRRISGWIYAWFTMTTHATRETSGNGLILIKNPFLLVSFHNFFNYRARAYLRF
jgi:hypothetical protein